MSAPKRIQRKRTKGFRLPPNTVCVTRPGPLGNPWLIVADDSGERVGWWMPRREKVCARLLAAVDALEAQG